MRTWTAATCDTQRLGIEDQGLVPRACPRVQGSVQSLKSKVQSPKKFGVRRSAFGVKIRNRTPHSALSNGFTLLELSVVLFIIGLLVTVTLPHLNSFSGGGTEASARQLSALVRYLSNEAAVSGRPYRLHYDLDQRAYWVTVFTPTRAGGEFLRDESPLSRRVQLPPAVAFVDVFIPGSGRVQSGHVYTNFYPQGYADPTIIHLRDQYAQITTVTIPPLTGEAWITDGYTDGFLPRR